MQAVYHAGFLAARQKGPFRRSVAANPCPLWSEAWHQWREGFRDGSNKALTLCGYRRTRQRPKMESHNGQRKN